MKYLILGTLCFWFLVSFPEVCLAAGIVLAFVYLLSEKSSPAEEKSSIPDDIDAPEFYKPFIDEDGVMDWEAYHKAEREKMMKPGFKDDPEWQRKAAEVREHMRKSRVQSDLEEQEAINEELAKNGQMFWRRARS